MEFIKNPAMLGPHGFKLAAMDKTIACPIEADLYLGDTRLLLGLILLALTALIDGWMISRKQAGKKRPSAPRDLETDQSFDKNQ